MTARRLRYTLSGYLFALPYLAVFAVFLALPLAIGFWLSFMRYDLLSTEKPVFAGMGNYRELLADADFWKALRATAWFSVLAVPLTMLMALSLALLLQAYVRGHNFLRGVVFLPTMLNIAVVAIIWQWFYNGEFGMFNYLLKAVGLRPVSWLTDHWIAMPSVVLMHLWWTIGGPAMILLASLKQIPGYYYEAAELDGANRRQALWHITLPMLRPVIVFTAVVSTIGCFQAFGQSFLLTAGGPELSTRMMVQYVYETSFNKYRLGYGAALSWALFTVLLVVCGLQQFLLREKEKG